MGGRRGQDAEARALRGAVHAAVARALSWDWDAAGFLARARRLDRRCHDLVARGGGRLLRGTSFYEDFVKTVCTVNTTWAGSVRMAERLVTRVGGGAFPTPGQVLAAGADALKAECGLGYRAAALARATQLLLDAGALDADGHGRADALGYETLLALPGIGPYAAAHCRVLLHDFSRLPIDSSVTAHMETVLARRRRKRNGRKTSASAALEAHFARWGEFRFLGYRLAKVAARLAAGEDVEW
jgi:N-glycosylase/DNA lyase